MITTLFQQLPHIYQSFLPDLFGREIPVEVYADCSDCNMCKPTTTVKDQRFFSKETKCCTFKPIVPNYLIGGILMDSKQPTKIHTYVDTGEKITPLGYFPSKEEFQHYARIIPDEFGIDETAKCELLDDGNCSIWQHRNSICSTYFCHYFKGFHGKRFWADVRDFLQFIEETLSMHCCYALDIPVNYLNQATTNFFINVQEALQDPPLPLPESSIWGPWVDKKSQFFHECQSICQNLSLTQLKKLNPTGFAIKYQALENSYNNMITPTLPPVLILNPDCQIIEFDEQQIFFYIERLIKFPRILKDVVTLFNGQHDCQTIIHMAADSYGVDMDNAYILHLYEQEILIQPSVTP